MTQMKHESNDKPAPMESTVVSRVTLLEMRVSQYRQRIEVLETGLGDATERLKATEKLIEHMQIRISATENHCSWTTDQISHLESRPDIAAQRPFASMFKSSVLYPVAKGGVKLLSMGLQAMPNNRDRALFWLYRKKPHLYSKLKQLSPAIIQPIEAATRLTHWRVMLEKDGASQQPSQPPVVPLSSTRNTATEVLSNPSFAGLPRPLPSVVESFSASTDKQDEVLRETTRLKQDAPGTATLSFLVLIQGQDPETIDRTLQSIFRQTDPSWELLLCAHKDPNHIVESWLDRDWRIRRITPLASETKALLSSAKVSTAMFIGLVSPGDVLDDDLVKRIGESIQHIDDVTAIYTNEACRTPDGDVVNHFFKPDWSPEHQLSVNVLGRFLAFRKQVLLDQSMGAWTDLPSAEYLLTLRLASGKSRVLHIDEVMYLRGGDDAAETFKAGGGFSAPQLLATQSPMQDYLRETLDPSVTVAPDQDSGAFRVRWSIPEGQEVTLVILTNMRYRNVEQRGNILMVDNFVRSIIEKSTFPNYKIIVVDDGYISEDLAALLKAHGHTSQTYRSEGSFSFSGKSNFASSLVSSGIVILLNDDLEVISEDWIEALVEQASRPEIGIVGGKLFFPDHSIQHAGISIGLNGSAGHVFMGQQSGTEEYAQYASVVRNYGAVTGALMAYRKEVFESLGGFDEFFRVDYNDIDFCLRCIAKGYRVVYTPYAKLYHFHNSTFNRSHDMSHERAEFLRRWKSWVDRDPYCGTHLAPICREIPQLNG